MSDPVYRVIELVGSSPNSIEDAIQNALSRAGETLRNLEWFQVVETRGSIAVNNMVGEFQVVLKVGFTIESRAA
jgi:dodecin